MSGPYAHILKLSESEKANFIDSFDIIFCDCDGVIWEATSHQPFQSVADGIKALQKLGKHVVFITNNSTRTDEDLLNKFKSAGLDVDLKDVVHPVRSIIEYLREIQFEGLIYCISTQTFQSALKNAGYKVISGPNQVLQDSFTDLARNVFDKEPVRAVIVDVDVNLSTPKLIRADVYLRHPACILIGGAADIRIPFSRDSTIGPGVFLRVLEDSSKRKALTFGKPGIELIAHLKKQYNITESRRVLLIGDILETDIRFGKMAGFQTMLVLTGGTSKLDMENNTDEIEEPDYYADSIADFTELFKISSEE